VTNPAKKERQHCQDDGAAKKDPEGQKTINNLGPDQTLQAFCLLARAFHRSLAHSQPPPAKAAISESIIETR
jgi:hypothetical protein